MHKTQARLADASLLLVGFIWGSGFIATEYAIRSGLTTSMIMVLRFAIAVLLMLPFVLRKLRQTPRAQLIRSAGAGVILFLGFFAQTYGQARTTVSNCAFLTATNVVMVPFIVWAITRKHPPMKVYVLSVCTLMGIGLLTLRPGAGFSIGSGDFYVLLCAVLFALHISYLGIFTRDIDAGVASFCQFVVAAALSAGAMLLLDREVPQAASIQNAILPLLFLGCLSTCLCFFIQTKAQQYTTPSKAGILLSTEGLFGSLLSVALGLEALTTQLVIGGLIIFGCVVLVGYEKDTGR